MLVSTRDMRKKKLAPSYLHSSLCFSLSLSAEGVNNLVVVVTFGEVEVVKQSLQKKVSTNPSTPPSVFHHTLNSSSLCFNKSILTSIALNT